jgi:hypothetical protein
VGNLELPIKSQELRDSIYTAVEYLSSVLAAATEAKRALYRAQCLGYDESEVIGRKLDAHEAALHSIISDSEKLQDNLLERIGINTNPNCICGQSSRCCPVHTSQPLIENRPEIEFSFIKLDQKQVQAVLDSLGFDIAMLKDTGSKDDHLKSMIAIRKSARDSIKEQTGKKST